MSIKNKKILIVGAGITGIVTALFCKKNNLSYDVLESTSASGGILRDWHFKEDWFFRNCQYLSTSSSWSKLLPTESLHVFPHTYASYTDIWGSITSYRGFAGPVYSSPHKLTHHSSTVGESLADRINIYPREISEGLMRWLDKLGLNPANLHSSCATGLQISRIFPCMHLDYIYQLKKNDPTADMVYGLPRQSFNQPPLYAAIPKGGYSDYLQNIALSLNISYKTIVRPESILEMSTTYSPGDTSKYLVWTGNPTPLIKYFSSSLDAPIFRARNLLLTHPSYTFPDPFYIQVYSLRHSIMRIYCYFDKITVECLDDGSDVDSLIDSCQEIMYEFTGLIQRPKSSFFVKDNRHFLVSIRDFETLVRFTSSICTFDNLIPSPWHQYGRGSKIESVLASVANLCAYG